jgi:WD40 repeat protein
MPSVEDYDVEPISIDVSECGKAIFIGTNVGTFRVYDVSNRAKPRLIKQLKFYDDMLPVTGIKSCLNGSVVIISSSESNIVYFMSQKSSEDFTIYGYAKVHGHVLSASFTLDDD